MPKGKLPPSFRWLQFVQQAGRCAPQVIGANDANEAADEGHPADLFEDHPAHPRTIGAKRRTR